MKKPVKIFTLLVFVMFAAATFVSAGLLNYFMGNTNEFTGDAVVNLNDAGTSLSNKQTTYPAVVKISSNSYPIVNDVWCSIGKRYSKPSQEKFCQEKGEIFFSSSKPDFSRRPFGSQAYYDGSTWKIVSNKNCRYYPGTITCQKIPVNEISASKDSDGGKNYAAKSASSIECKPGQLMGDVDGNGMITKDDADLILKISSGLIPYPKNICCVDLAPLGNVDGLINSGDATVVLRISKNLEKSPGICKQSLLISKYLSSDKDAIKIAEGLSETKLPSSAYFPDRDIKWRLVNAYRLIGYEPAGIPWGAAVNKDKILEIDKKVYEMEKVITKQSNKLPFYKEHSGPDFKDNLPQDFAAYLFATIFNLYNSGSTKYESYTYECLFANLYPQMKGSLVEMGKKTPFVVQTPELFGFSSQDRYAIGPNEYPKHPIPTISTCGYASTVIHEFVHNFDSRSRNRIEEQQRQASGFLMSECGNNLMNFTKQGSPFLKEYVRGTQDKNDFISLYASGLTSSPYTYSSGEDAAESVSAYMLTPGYFRTRMQNSALLKAKYDYIKKNIFGGIEFENPHLDTFGDKLFSKIPPTINVEYSGNIKSCIISDIRILKK